MRRRIDHARRSRSALARLGLAAGLAVLLLQLAVSSGLAAHGGTHIPSTTYAASTTWTLAGSPYVIDGSVTVSAGATLTIEPGVIVKFNGSTRRIVVHGSLQALGTEAQPVTFTSLQDDSAGPARARTTTPPPSPTTPPAACSARPTRSATRRATPTTRSETASA